VAAVGPAARLCGIGAALSLLAACASPGDRASSSAPSPTALTGLTQRDEPALPEPRQETAAAGDAQNLWVLGGYDTSSRSSPDVLRFDGAWHRERALPVGLDHPSAASLAGALYVAGGFSRGPASRRVFRLSGPSATWQEVAPLTHARGGLALVPLGGRLYALGGNDSHGEVAPAEEYDPQANRWRDLPDLPHPRNHVAGYASQGQACIAGGRAPNVELVTCWDVSANRWRDGPRLPVSTSGAGAGVAGQDPIVAGGEDPGGGTLVTQLARLRGGAWEEGAMRAPRHGIQLAPYRGRLWACGGGDRAGLHPVATCTSIGP
jgi:hypothetical protein